MSLDTDVLVRLEFLIDSLQATERSWPGGTVAETIERFVKMRQDVLARRLEDVRTCKHCGYPVAEDGAGRLVHRMPSGELGNVGCRAASWLRRQEEGLEGWDESMNDQSTAQVARERRRAKPESL